VIGGTVGAVLLVVVADHYRGSVVGRAGSVDGDR
jgi:hypothetical protein